MKLTLVVALTLGVGIGCNQYTTADKKIDRGFTPTAIELFNLRSRCSELAERIGENDSAACSNGKCASVTPSRLSHYDSVSGHCYVELLWVYTAKGVTSSSKELYDGQTRGLLAHCDREAHKEPFGQIFMDGWQDVAKSRGVDIDHPSSNKQFPNADWGIASNFIDAMMKEQR